jgi:hypothetical protein
MDARCPSWFPHAALHHRHLFCHDQSVQSGDLAVPAGRISARHDRDRLCDGARHQRCPEFGAVLVVAWLWSGIGFHLLHFSTINFAAPAYAGVFTLQAVLVAWLCIARGSVRFRFVPDTQGLVGVALVGLGATTWPMIGLVVGSGEYTSAPMFAADPTATVLLTLGVLLLAEGRAVIWLAVIPVLWTFVDGATFFVLGAPAGLTLPMIGLVVFALLVLKRRTGFLNRREG